MIEALPMSAESEVGGHGKHATMSRWDFMGQSHCLA